MESDFELLIGPFLFSVTVGLFYLVVYWRIFNKARRSGVLLLLNFLLGAALPWILAAEPNVWLWVIATSASWLIGLGIYTTVISIIGRPGWWLLPYLLVSVPVISLQIWGAQASAFEDPPDSLAYAFMACVILALLMFIPMYFVGMYDLGDAFGKGTGFRLGLMFLPFIFLPILAFDNSRYGDWGGAKRPNSAYVPPRTANFAGATGSQTSTAPGPAGGTNGSSLPSIPPLRLGAPSGPVPGWYADPDGSPSSRWWDGTAWTDHLDPPGTPDATGAVPSDTSRSNPPTCHWNAAATQTNQVSGSTDT